jgi:hypothetical protein
VGRAHGQLLVLLLVLLLLLPPPLERALGIVALHLLRLDPFLLGRLHGESLLAFLRKRFFLF